MRSREFAPVAGAGGFGGDDARRRDGTANALNLTEHSAVRRMPANQIQPDAHPGLRFVTRDLGRLAAGKVGQALERRSCYAAGLLWRDLIVCAALQSRGHVRVAPMRGIPFAPRSKPIPEPSVRVRKLVTVVEEMRIEVNRQIVTPMRRAAAIAVIENPVAGAYVRTLDR